MYDQIKNGLQGISDTLSVLGTMPLNANNISMQMAYDKDWGGTAEAARTAIISLEEMLNQDATVTEICYRSIEPYIKFAEAQERTIQNLRNENERLKETVLSLKPNEALRDFISRVLRSEDDRDAIERETMK